MKWEYSISFLSSFEHIDKELGKHFGEYLNRMGQEGWEMITVDNGLIYFKRAIELKPNARIEEVE